MTKASITDASSPDGLTARLAGPRPAFDCRAVIATRAVVDIGLAGSIASARYAMAARRRCCLPRTPVRAAGCGGAVAVSELLSGEDFDLFDCVGDWGFGRSVHDGYTGWVELVALGDPLDGKSRPVTARCAPVFASPDIKAAVRAELPLGARVTGLAQGNFFALSEGGFVHFQHLEPFAGVPLAAARRFTGAPYVWGGRTPLGVDCSGLVQAALATCGVAAPRDSDQQLQALGVAVDFADRRSGDLLFFPGHVGMLVDADTLFHANAHWMAVVEEPLADVIARGAAVTGVRRV